MKEFQDEAMGDWEEVPPAPQKTRKKKEFTEETAKKYWEMRTADFAREKRASVTHSNRGAKKLKEAGETMGQPRRHGYAPEGRTAGGEVEVAGHWLKFMQDVVLKICQKEHTGK